MAAASANGGSIGGNSIANNIPNDVQGQQGEQDSFVHRAVIVRPEAVAAAGNGDTIPRARCVSPEPLAKESAQSISYSPQVRSFNTDIDHSESMSIESRNAKRRRL